MVNRQFVVGVFPDCERIRGSFAHRVRRYLHNTLVPKMSVQTSFPSFSAVAGAHGSRSSLSENRRCAQCYTLVERLTACECDLGLHSSRSIRSLSGGTIRGLFRRFAAGIFRKTSSADTSAISQRDTYSPTSRGLGFASLSCRVVQRPHGAFLWRTLCHAGTAEPNGFSPAELVDY